MDIPKPLLLFTDGSVNMKTKIGRGAYLAVREQDLSRKTLEPAVRVKRFENTSSTELELQTLLWALNEFPTDGEKVIIYTDSQNILELQGRRERLERKDFRSGKGQLLRHHELYRQFYQMMDQLDCEIVKVKGHQRSIHKGSIERLFTLVDRASRKATREGIR